MIIDQLCGLEFNMDNRNCYTLLRDFYKLNYEIELSDYACPTDWWENGLNIYRDLAHQEGFKIVDDPPYMWRPGDVIMMALGASVVNHVGIIVPGGKMLHHLRGTRSCVTPYGSMFRNNTMGVYRHPSVPEFQHTNVDLKDVLPPNIARLMEKQKAL